MRKTLNNIPLSTIYRLFRQGDVQVKSHTVKPEDRLRKGDILLISLPEDLAPTDAQKPDGGSAATPSIHASGSGHDGSLAGEMPKIVWQNKHLVAFHKPRGMLVHDGQESLNAYVLRALRGQLSPSVSFSPGPLHRLDRNTSGIVVFSKTRMGAEKFTEAIRDREVRKFYIAIVESEVRDALVFHDVLSRDAQRRVSIIDEKGKRASLHALPLLTNNDHSLLVVELHTGLTHQIRAQFAAHGIPLAGDTKYGGQRTLKIQSYFLHAYCLHLKAPLFEDMPLDIIDPLPEDFHTMSKALFDVSSETLDAAIVQGIERLLEH